MNGVDHLPEEDHIPDIKTISVSAEPYEDCLGQLPNVYWEPQNLGTWASSKSVAACAARPDNGDKALELGRKPAEYPRQPGCIDNNIEAEVYTGWVCGAAGSGMTGRISVARKLAYETREL